MSKKIKLKNLLEENFSTIGGVVSRPTFTNNIISNGKRKVW